MRKIYCNVCRASFSKSHNCPNLELNLFPARKVMSPEVKAKLEGSIFRKTISMLISQEEELRKLK